jgi:AraC-like DNA-binding protein
MTAPGSSSARGPWVIRAVDAAQVLMGALSGPESETLGRELAKFERQCPPPRVMSECLILRAILLDVFSHLEDMFQDETPRDARSSARARLYRSPPTATLSAFLEAARQLVAEADRGKSLPLHERARRWIIGHVDDHCTVRELAARLGTNSRTLSRQFRRNVGVTLQQYRWDCRALRAAELMSATDLKVDAVASAIGVRSKSTLYRLLRRAGQTVRRRKAPKRT